MTLWAFDIETSEWDRFLLGAAVSEDGDEVRFDRPAEFLEWYSGTWREDKILVHNGGRFDLLWVLDQLPDSGWTNRTAGSSIVTLRYKDLGCFYDTFRMIPLGLAKFGAKDEWDHSKNEDLTAAEREELYRYCAQDCRALLDGWTRYVEGWDAMDLARTAKGRERLTIGSVAFATARKLHGDDAPEPLSLDVYRTSRAGYYGGRCEVYRVDCARGHSYDLNSAYPAALLDVVPVGAPQVLLGMSARAAYSRGRPGIYRADVYLHSERTVPLLPHRHRDSLVWSTGWLRGSWALPELQWAETRGMAILAIHSAQVWTALDAYYAPFVERFYAERKLALESGDAPWSAWLKIFLNSLSGKLAERPERESVKLFAECPGEKWEPYDGNMRHWRLEESRIPPNARPAQAAYLTARTRIALAERLIDAEKNGGAIYCDTDGVRSVATNDRGVDPTKLGAWKYEGDIGEWRAIGPKLYEYQLSDGSWCVKAKGVPKATRDDFERLFAGQIVKKTLGVETLKLRLSAGDGRFFRARVHEKSVRRDRRVAGTRLILDNGTTAPLFRKKDGSYEWPTSPNLKVTDLLPHLRKRVFSRK